jgi:hypothetical protein
LLKGERSGKYTPVEYAQWIEDYADEAAKHLAQAEVRAEGKKRPEYRRMAIDVAMLTGLGRFFGAKFRSGVLYAIFEQSGDRAALEQALKLYQEAQTFWSELANRAGDVYKPDITIGENAVIRGHWLDRLPAIEEDIAFMANKLEQIPVSAVTKQDNVRLAIQEAMGRPIRNFVVCRHSQPEKFIAGQPLDIELSFEKTIGSVRLYYRHVNQAERYETVEMQVMGKSYRATIPGDYSNSQYPLQYYFELKEGPDKAGLYPGFNADLTNQPYFVVRKA